MLLLLSLIVTVLVFIDQSKCCQLRKRAWQGAALSRLRCCRRCTRHDHCGYCCWSSFVVVVVIVVIVVVVLAVAVAVAVAAAASAVVVVVVVVVFVVVCFVVCSLSAAIAPVVVHCLHRSVTSKSKTQRTLELKWASGLHCCICCCYYYSCCCSCSCCSCCSCCFVVIVVLVLLLCLIVSLLLLFRLLLF